MLDMGDVFINSKHVYEVTLLNKGDIAANWALQAPPTPFASKFRFGPMQGTLDVKDRCAQRTYFPAHGLLFSLMLGTLLHPRSVFHIVPVRRSCPLGIRAVHLRLIENLR